MRLSQIPQPLLVFIVLTVGILSFFVLQKPHSVCDSQVEVFKELQRGVIYSSLSKGGSPRPPVIKSQLETCRLGSSPGACYELFASLRKIVRDLQSLPNDCSSVIGDEAEIRQVLLVGARLMVELAWGGGPPNVGIDRLAWLETSDLALFCGMRDQVTRLLGAETWDQMRLATYETLPGEKPILKDGVCTNCEGRKSAAQSLSQEEIWNRSIFSIRCDQYR